MAVLGSIPIKLWPISLFVWVCLIARKEPPWLNLQPVLWWWSHHVVVYLLLWYCCCGKHMAECEKEDHHQRTGSNRHILRGTPFAWHWLSEILQFDTQPLGWNIQLLSTNPFFQHNFSVQFITFGIDWHRFVKNVFWLKINFITESKYCLCIAHILSTHH